TTFCRNLKGGTESTKTRGLRTVAHDSTPRFTAGIFTEITESWLYYFFQPYLLDISEWLS
ncbi:MAG: hypothetical protein ACP5MB_11640, partial [bacterium]